MCKKGDVMYTEDDKYTKHKKTESRSKKSNVVNNITYDEDFYKDFQDENYDNYFIDYSLSHYNDDNVRNSKKKNINKLDTSYTDDLSDNTYYNYDKKALDKKKFTVIIIILAIFVIALVCILIRTINIKNPPKGNNLNYVRLENDQLNMKIGETKKLELILSNSNSDYKIEWFSNNDNVVTVDNNGNLFAINEGNAVILVAYYLEDKVYDTQCYITVSK